jgi:pSer/pThr/pTyr-binding forkhead associated (FHA) protein
MAVFGRLDVFYPDGHVETYPLSGDTVSVGRAEGNTIALETDTISRYHFSITQQDGVVQLTDLDSANGTYIDGTELNSNNPYLLDDVEEIQIGHLRIIYHPGSDSATIPVSPLTDDSTQPSNMGFRVSLETSQVDVWPASSSSVEIAVTNSGDSEQQFQIVSSGLPETWAKFNRPFMMIDGLDTTYVLLNIKPSRRADIPPQDYPVEIRVSPLDQPDKFIQLELIVSLKGFNGFGMALSPEVIHSDDDIHLYMLNQGNETLTVNVSGNDPTQQLAFELPTGDVQLAPGQRTQVTGKVKPRNRPLVGNAIDIPFAMVVKADTDSAYIAAVPGKVHVQPRLANWMLGTIGGILVATVLVLFVFLSQTPEPKIQEFSISESQVQQGTPIELSWSASDSQTYHIEVNRVPVADLSTDITTYTLNTSSYTDPIEVALIAVNGDLQDIKKEQVEVYEPATIHSFDVAPLELVRNVSSTLVLSWSVSGSVSTYVVYPDGFSQQDTGATDNMVLLGVPDSDFGLILSVEDEIGTKSESSVDITTVDPECTLIEDETILRQGPDSLFPDAAKVTEDVPVKVIGINESRDWLHVELSSGDNGWGFTGSFNCENFDPANMVVSMGIPILPTALPTLPSTPTSIPTETPLPTSTTVPTAIPTTSPTPIQSATPDEG